MNYSDRLRELNTITEGKTVWDSIDRPIRPLVYILNKAGIKTKFSCCGFSYNGEEEPKTHAKYPFIVFELGPEKEIIFNFFRLASVAWTGRWMLNPYSPSQWHLSFRENKPGNFYSTEDGAEGIHDYEASLLAIRNLYEHCSRKLTMVNETVKIIDGNSDESYSVLMESGR